MQLVNARIYVATQLELRHSISTERQIFELFYMQKTIMKIRVVLDSRIRTSSSNARVIIGSTVTFECATDSDRDIRWYFCSVGLPGCDKPTVVYNGDELDPTLLPRFAVAVFTARSAAHISQLTITDTELGDSGTYSCAEADTFSTQRHFVLDVLGKLSK